MVFTGNLWSNVILWQIVKGKSTSLMVDWKILCPGYGLSRVWVVPGLGHTWVSQWFNRIMNWFKSGLLKLFCSWAYTHMPVMRDILWMKTQIILDIVKLLYGMPQLLRDATIILYWFGFYFQLSRVFEHLIINDIL